MNKIFNLKDAVQNTQVYKAIRDRQQLSRRPSLFEVFAGEFANTNISFQNINGFILPLQEA